MPLSGLATHFKTLWLVLSCARDIQHDCFLTCFVAVIVHPRGFSASPAQYMGLLRSISEAERPTVYLLVVRYTHHNYWQISLSYLTLVPFCAANLRLVGERIPRKVFFVVVFLRVCVLCCQSVRITCITDGCVICTNDRDMLFFSRVFLPFVNPDWGCCWVCSAVWLLRV